MAATSYAAFLLAFCCLRLLAQDSDYDCSFKEDEEKPEDCCGAIALPADFKANQEACLERDQASKNDPACRDQCTLEAGGTMTAEKRLSRTKVLALLRNNDENAKVVNTVLKECLVTLADPDADGDDFVANANVESDSPCKSGAFQILQCYISQAYFNCPEGFLKQSDGCKKLKEKMERCTK